MSRRRVASTRAPRGSRARPSTRDRRAAHRIFGLASLWEGVKALLKTLVIGGVIYVVIQGLVPVLMSAGRLPLTAVLDTAAGGITAVLQAAVAAGLGLALFDVLVVRRRNRKHTSSPRRKRATSTRTPTATRSSSRSAAAGSWR